MAVWYLEWIAIGHGVWHGGWWRRCVGCLISGHGGGCSDVTALVGSRSVLLRDGTRMRGDGDGFAKEATILVLKEKIRRSAKGSSEIQTKTTWGRIKSRAVKCLPCSNVRHSYMQANDCSWYRDLCRFPQFDCNSLITKETRNTTSRSMQAFPYTADEKHA
jgi:hypothetical protein